MEKIKEKPDPTAKMAIDFDNKQAAEREKQVCVCQWHFTRIHLCFVGENPCSK